MLNRNPVHHSVLSRISVLPKQATTISSEDAVYHSRQQQASPRVTVRLPQSLALRLPLHAKPWKRDTQVQKAYTSFVLNAQSVFKITDCRYCSTKWRSWEEILHYPVTGGKCSFSYQIIQCIWLVRILTFDLYWNSEY